MSIKRIVSHSTGMEAYTIQKTADERTVEWDVLPKASTVELSKEETLIGEAKKFDLAKFLKVKQCLMDGMNPSQIKKEHGIARTATLNYKVYFDKDSLDRISKIQQIISQTTQKI